MMKIMEYLTETGSKMVRHLQTHWRIWARGGYGFGIKASPWILIIFFSYLYIWLAWLNDSHLRNGLDLGIFHQGVYLLSEGELPQSSLKQQMLWGDHASFVLVPIAMVYRFFPDVRTLLVLQVLAITTSGWALWATARKKVKSDWFALALLASYLMFFGIQYALDFDFHPAVFTAGAIAWTLFFLTTKRYTWYAVAVALGLLTQEDAAPVFAMIGAWLLFQKRWQVGGATLATALVYFVIVTYFIMPQWTPGNIRAVHFDIGGSTGSPVRNLAGAAVHPLRTWQNMTDTGDKRRTLKELSRSFGYTHMLSPFTYLASAPNLVSRMLSDQYPRHMVSYHYNVQLAPVFAFGSILTVAWFSKKAKEKYRNWSKWHFFIPMIAGVLVLYGAWATSWQDPDLPLRQLQEPEFTEKKYRPIYSRPALEIVKAMIPNNRSVSVASGLLPVLSDRKYVFNFPEPFPKQTQWVVLSPEFNTWPLPRGEMESYIEQFKEDPDYELVMEDYGLFVFKKIARQVAD